MSKNDPAERAVHGLGRHPHGLSECLQVVERGVGQAEGVHQHAGVTADGRAAAIAWTPPGFRAFDTGTVDDSASADDEGTTAPNRNRLWQTRRWAMRRKMLAITPTVAPIHRAPTATPLNPGIRRPVLRRTMSPIPLRRRRRVP